MTSEGGLPPLSPTYQTTQMLTPRYLERITIDNPHYHGHLTHSLHTDPPHINMLQRRVQKMGDNYFFVHKDIPERQSYVRTSLKLSEIRPWDQIVERPLTSDRILHKELHLPFPAEHPYSSHISRFAVFPDTHPTQPTLPSLQDSQMPATQDGRFWTSISVHTQTPVGDDASYRPLPLAPHSPTPYYVLQKASERGQRVESRHLSMPAGVEMQGNCLKWDFPRSHRHQRSYTYPAPTLQFAPRTPAILPHPSHLHFSHSSSCTPLTPHTQEALHSIHNTLSRTTTYTDQFPGKSHVVQNMLQLEHLHRESHRPWTAESRGKYSMRTFSGTPYMDKSGAKVPGDRYVMEVVRNGESYDNQTENDTQFEMKEDAVKEEESEKRKVVLSSPGEDGVDDGGQVSKVDKATQTDLEFLSLQETTPLPMSHALPHLNPITPSPSTPHPSQPHTPHKLPQLPTTHFHLSTSNYSPQRPHTALDQSYTPTQPKLVDSRPHTSDTYTPRSVVSTRRLMGLFNNYSRTEVLRRFHDQYPEGVPDLRDYSIREGKRHVIHGHHAYYFH